MEMLIMPMGKGTYGSKRGRPPAKKNGNGTAKKLMSKNPKMPAKVAKAISKNMRKK
jgi:hypothetical protein